MVEDLAGWEENILLRLEQWQEETPRHPENSPYHHMNHLCDIKYHELVMLVLRPNPRRRQPSQASLGRCSTSAIECCNLYHQLYVSKSLHYGWISVHSLFLCVMTLFYCVWTPPGITGDAQVDQLMRALKASSDILSAMGEYWPEASRSRDILDCVSAATVRRFLSKPPIAEPQTTSTSSLTFQEPMNSDIGLVSSELATPRQTPNDPVPPATITSLELESSMFPDTYWNQEDAFMSNDFLSFFLDTNTDTEPLDRMTMDTGFM